MCDSMRSVSAGCGASRVQSNQSWEHWRGTRSAGGGSATPRVHSFTKGSVCWSASADNYDVVPQPYEDIAEDSEKRGSTVRKLA